MGTGLAQGSELLRDRVLQLLARSDVRPFDVVGEPFDSSRMRAVGSTPATAQYADGTVSALRRPGFMNGHVVLRPAEVMVARERSGKGG